MNAVEKYLDYSIIIIFIQKNIDSVKTFKKYKWNVDFFWKLH